jgi:peptidoglycan/xylan/chitin deacetylase (PgdA/CDA1 family)
MQASTIIAITLAIIIPCLLLSALLYATYRPPNFLINYFQRRWPDILWRVDTKQKVVALTIDDSPSEFTEEILQILKANDASATYFIIGSQIPGYENTLQDIIRSGSQLGNHAMHDEFSRLLTDADLKQQLQAVDAKLLEAYNACNEDPPHLFRPGWGFFSTRMRKIIASAGYRLVLGNIFPFDPQVPFWRVNAWHILSMLQPGAIIICHDRRSWTAPMLRKVLPEMKRRGYKVMTVTELLNVGD